MVPSTRFREVGHAAVGDGQVAEVVTADVGVDLTRTTLESRDLLPRSDIRVRLGVPR